LKNGGVPIEKITRRIAHWERREGLGLQKDW